MKKIFITLSLILLFAGYGKAQEEQPQMSVQEQQAMTLTGIYSATYQRALRYNDFGAAKNALYKLVTMYPKNDSLLYSLSLLYFQGQQYASAALAAQDVLTLNPENSGALEISAISFQQLGANEKALEAYEGLYLQTDNFESLYQMAFLQYQVGRLQESLTNIDILMGKKEAEELTVSFRTANNEQKDYPIKAALFNLKGLIFKQQNNSEEAKQAFSRALEIAPDFQMAKENMESLNE